MGLEKLKLTLLKKCQCYVTNYWFMVNMQLCRVMDAHVKLARVGLGYCLMRFFHHGPIIVCYQHINLKKIRQNKITCAHFLHSSSWSLCAKAPSSRSIKSWRTGNRNISVYSCCKQSSPDLTTIIIIIIIIIKTIDGTLWKLTLMMPNIMNVAPIGKNH